MDESGRKEGYAEGDGSKGQRILHADVDLNLFQRSLTWLFVVLCSDCR